MIMAVYGTLRKGEHNEYYLGNARYIKTIRLKGFCLYSYCGIPVASESKLNDEITVELYEIDSRTFKQVKRLEHGYNQKIIEVEDYSAMIWLMKPYNGFFNKIESGDWKDR